MKLATWLVSAFIVPAVIAGCSTESRHETMHQPGVYKGKDDPLLAKQPQDQVLADRFKLVQADR